MHLSSTLAVTLVLTFAIFYLGGWIGASHFIRDDVKPELSELDQSWSSQGLIVKTCNADISSHKSKKQEDTSC